MLQSDPGTLQREAVRSGSIPLRQAGLVFTGQAYECATKPGSLAIVKWLLREAGVFDPRLPMRDVLPLVQDWPGCLTVGNRSLLQAVQWVLEEADRRVQRASGAGEQPAAGVRPDTANTNMGLNAVLFAVRRCDPALVQYLTEQRSTPKPRGAMVKELFSGAAQAGCEALME